MATESDVLSWAMLGTVVVACGGILQSAVQNDGHTFELGVLSLGACFVYYLTHENWRVRGIKVYEFLFANLFVICAILLLSIFGTLIFEHLGIIDIALRLLWFVWLPGVYGLARALSPERAKGDRHSDEPIGVIWSSYHTARAEVEFLPARGENKSAMSVHFVKGDEQHSANGNFKTVMDALGIAVKLGLDPDCVTANTAMNRLCLAALKEMKQDLSEINLEHAIRVAIKYQVMLDALDELDKS